MFNRTAAALSAVSLVALLFVSSQAFAFRNLEEGKPVPDFNLTDTAGNAFTLSGLKGKVVVVLFFRPDQQNSQEALADLETIHNKYGAKGVSVLAVTPEIEQLAQLKAVMDKAKITYPVLLDQGRKVYGSWGVFLYPTTGVIDKDGNLEKHVPSYNRKYAETVEGNVRLALGEIDKAHLESMLNPKEMEKLSPEQKKAERHMMLGGRMVERKLLDRAADEYSQAVEADPNLVEARIKYGFVLLKMGDAKKATEQFTKAIELDPKAEEARTGMGAAEVASGDLDKGIQVLEDALKLNTKPARTHFELGRAYEKKGAPDKAAEHYRKAIEELAGAAW